MSHTHHHKTGQPIITFEKVNKWYGNNFHVLRDIDLSVAKGERIVITREFVKEGMTRRGRDDGDDRQQKSA